MTEKEEQEQRLNATTTALIKPTIITSSTVGDGGSGDYDGDDGDVEQQVNNPIIDTTINNSKELRQPFPMKVYEMLEDADRPEKNFSHIVSWNPIGNGFKVHNKDCFTKEIVPHYFNLTKYKSFQRQLSLYGFQRITVGPDKGLRFHDKLRRSQLELVKQMKPVGYKPRNTGKGGEITSTTKVTTTCATPTVVKTTTTGTSTSTSIDLVPDPTNTTSTTTMMTATTPIVKLTEYPPKSSVALSVISSHEAIDAPAVTMTVIDHPNIVLMSSGSRSIPPVVSSSSLIKQHQDAIIIEEKHRHQLENNNNNNKHRFHTISPEATFSIHTASSNGECSDNDNTIRGGEGKGNSSNSNNSNKQDDEYYQRDQGIQQQQQQQQQQIGHFEVQKEQQVVPIQTTSSNDGDSIMTDVTTTSSLSSSSDVTTIVKKQKHLLLRVRVRVLPHHYHCYRRHCRRLEKNQTTYYQ
ncbi:hypothetical protein FRACYDRAFT_232609 [Fragilariopsis cylindrus CCMP1102]|uniref:HSF-type DNA-binding domain-containing protein n=1 Tax=Fragilariopsis cylindrus CCMP1102 TaxID=635003 RepID=A0A1E7FWC4_9STRA|nr:hypothetical protein FRACYDRAFT_232609 [Fragilariopsis cylindrus CCMP1102]|eukprot:OEU22452.1 hypothetical protein FRACYDRAFT_232609 [Fragilariopsis cylindrus CCMP1102]